MLPIPFFFQKENCWVHCCSCTSLAGWCFFLFSFYFSCGRKCVCFSWTEFESSWVQQQKLKLKWPFGQKTCCSALFQNEKGPSVLNGTVQVWMRSWKSFLSKTVQECSKEHFTLWFLSSLAPTSIMWLRRHAKMLVGTGYLTQCYWRDKFSHTCFGCFHSVFRHQTLQQLTKIPFVWLQFSYF